MRTSQQTFLLASLLLFSAAASAHCDSLDGPVIRDAIQQSLDWIGSKTRPL